MVLYTDLISKGLEKKYPGGHWVTIRGRRVYIKSDGKFAMETAPVWITDRQKKGAKGNEQGKQKEGFGEGLGREGREGAQRDGGVTEKRGYERRENQRHAQISADIKKATVKSHGELLEINNPKIFHRSILAAKKNNPYGVFVHAYESDEYKEMRMFVLPNGLAGVAVTGDGDIVSVFKNPEQEGSVMGKLMLVALQNGGKKLDCFDGYLAKQYSKYGFIAESKIKFNREFAPEGWNYERDGEPDVIFFRHNGDSVEKIAETDYPLYDGKAVPVFDDYDDAVKIRDSKIKKSLLILFKSFKDKLPEGGIWRTVRGRKVYIKDGKFYGGDAAKQLYLSKFKSDISICKGKKFNDIISAELKREGDALLSSGETGYNVSLYEGSKAGKNGFYEVLTGKKCSVVYNMYNQHIEHGEELLKKLFDEGLNIPYDVTIKGSSVKWDPDWGEEPECEYEEVNGQLIGRSVEYGIVFYPENTDDADKLGRFFRKYVERDSEDAIDKSWDVPDIRVGGKAPFAIDGYKGCKLNRKRIGNENLLVLTKDRELKGFETSEISLNPGLAEFIKSLFKEVLLLIRK